MRARIRRIIKNFTSDGKIEHINVEFEVDGEILTIGLDAEEIEGKPQKQLKAFAVKRLRDSLKDRPPKPPEPEVEEINEEVELP